MTRSALALALLALALGGCETSAEKSAKIEKEAKAKAAVARAQSVPLARRVAHASTRVKVIAAATLRSSEGTAAVITLQNTSAASLRDVPIEIDVLGPGRRTLYTNSTAGLGPTLVSVGLIPAHATLRWIDDQVQAAATPVGVRTRVGEGEPVSGALPGISVEGHLTASPEGGARVEGHAVNHSAVEQRELVVNCVALRAGRIVAAGRAVLPLLAPHGSARFEVFFVGSPAGAQLQLSAPATALG